MQKPSETVFVFPSFVPLRYYRADPEWGRIQALQLARDLEAALAPHDVEVVHREGMIEVVPGRLRGGRADISRSLVLREDDASIATAFETMLRPLRDDDASICFGLFETMAPAYANAATTEYPRRGRGVAATRARGISMSEPRRRESRRRRSSSLR